MTGVVSPLAVPNSTQFTPLPPGSNNQPAMVPGKNIVIALNARVYSPTIVDSQGNVKMFVPPNASYTMTGTENTLIQVGSFQKDKKNNTLVLEIRLLLLLKSQEHTITYAFSILG